MSSFTSLSGFSFVNENNTLLEGEKTVDLTISKSSGPVTSADIRKLAAYFFGLIASRPGEGMRHFIVRSLVRATYHASTTSLNIPGFVLQFRQAAEGNQLAEILWYH